MAIHFKTKLFVVKASITKNLSPDIVTHKLTKKIKPTDKNVATNK